MHFYSGVSLHPQSHLSEIPPRLHSGPVDSTNINQLLIQQNPTQVTSESQHGDKSDAC
jgi:hypothetical protein